MAGFNELPAEYYMALGGGIMSAPTLGQGIGTGFTNAASVLAEQREKAEAEKKLGLTYQALQKMDPEKAELFKAGVLTGPQAYNVLEQEKARREAASRPSYKWMNIDGKLVRIDENTGQQEQMADYSEPKQIDPTSIQRDLQAAGLQPGTPEYKQAILEHYRKSGTIVDVAPDGSVRFVQGNVDPAKMPKVTEAEGKNAGFLKRALTAEKELSALESEGTSLWNRAADAVPVLGNYAKSDEAQKFDQAQRNFINAVLRRESGAVISPEEFDNARKQYFPQPGDGPDVIAQKRKNREDAITGFEIGSGPAAEKVREMDETQPKTAPIPAEDYFK